MLYAFGVAVNDVDELQIIAKSGGCSAIEVTMKESILLLTDWKCMNQFKLLADTNVKCMQNWKSLV